MMFKKILMVSVFLAFPLMAKADFVTGERYFNERNYSAAFSAFLPDADAGDPRSQYYIGYLYYNGLGVPQNAPKAVEYLTAAAGKNHTSAQTLLGYLYEQGQVVALNKKKAIELYTAAAQQKDPSAMFNLGLAYYQGNGVARDIRKAIDLLSQIPTDETRPYVGRYLGEFYLTTEDSDKNEKAKNYFSQSAKAGDIDSFYFLGQIFEEEGNLNQAIDYYTYAASQQNPTAQYILGTMYVNGTGTDKDLIQGYAWLEMAANQQYEPAQQALKELAQAMTLSQSERAREEFNRIQRDVINKVESPYIIQQRIDAERAAAQAEIKPTVIFRRR